MLSVEEALALVLEHTSPLAAQRLAVDLTVGCVLAEDVVSDIDSPPYDKSAVDGFALRSADHAAGQRELRVIEEVTAGDWPRHSVASGAATRIMTGAPLPDGADAVVMVEHTEARRWNDAPVVRLGERPVRAGQNVLRRAQSLQRGQTVLRAGRTLRPIEAGLLSEVGRAEVVVVPRPRVAVLATGNELVPARQVPTRAQIRNSNGPMLRCLAEQAGGIPVELGIARDEADDLRAHIARGLEAHVLVLSGGVSAGVLDLAPRALCDLGVEQVFHQVHLRPGKPLWFGVRSHADATTIVFGLPGNPVSSLVCWDLFVRPALERLQGRPAQGLARATGVLAAPHEHRGDRPTYWPAAADLTARFAGEPQAVRLLNWQGSADLRTLCDANCLACFPAGDRVYAAGETVSLRLL